MEIRGLEIAVDDPVFVGGLEAAGELSAEAQDVLFGKRPVAQSLGERRAGHELHDQEVDAVFGVEVEEVGDVGMREPGESVGFPAEAGARGIVGEGALGQDLEGEVTVELLVVGAVDLAHPARAEALDDPIVGERATDHATSSRCSGKLGEGSTAPGPWTR